MIGAIVALAAIVTTAAGAWLAWRSHPEVFRHAAIYYSGRAEGCSLTQTLNPIDGLIELLFLDLVRTIEPIETTPTERNKGLTLWSTPLGSYWAAERSGLAYVLAEQSLDLYEIGDAGLTPQSVVLDCGANIGTFTRAALEAGAGRVIAIEPSPRNVRALELNFPNEIESGRVIVVSKAVWHEPGVLPLHSFPNPVLDSLVMDAREGQESTPVEVPLDTLDAIVAGLDLERVDFIKMDIEGAERNALRGARETIRRHRPTMSIAAENLLDDVRVVPALVDEILPEYEFQTGPCGSIDGEIRPEVLLFRLGTDQ